MTPDERDGLDGYLFLSSVSIFLNILVVLFILRKRAQIRTAYLVMLMYFHLSVACDIITAIPYAFSWNYHWCLLNQSLKFYFGLMNLFITFILIQGNRIIIFEKSQTITSQKKLFAYFLMFFFPCIAFIPYLSHSYYVDPDNPFCTLTYSARDATAIFYQYSIAWLILFTNGITNFMIIYELYYVNYNPNLLRRYRRNVLSYSVISAIGWIPRFAVMFAFTVDDDDSIGPFLEFHFYQYFPMLGTGVIFVLLFIRNQRFLFDLEHYNEQQSDIKEIMTFDHDELLKILNSLSDRSSVMSASGQARGSSFRGSQQNTNPSNLTKSFVSHILIEGLLSFTLPSKDNNASKHNSSSSSATTKTKFGWRNRDSTGSILEITRDSEVDGPTVSMQNNPPLSDSHLHPPQTLSESQRETQTSNRGSSIFSGFFFRRSQQYHQQQQQQQQQLEQQHQPNGGLLSNTEPERRTNSTEGIVLNPVYDSAFHKNGANTRDKDDNDNDDDIES